jgi:hypothetical protein
MFIFDMFDVSTDLDRSLSSLDYLDALKLANHVQDYSRNHAVTTTNVIHRPANVLVRIRRVRGSAIEMANDKHH